MDRTEVPPKNWLQFDIKNQEFFGTPMSGDEGRKEYQLVRQLQILFSSSLMELLNAGTDMRCLTMGIRSEKCIVRRFRCCANVIVYFFFLNVPTR
jgi:hypothetical protein